ncbi:MAG: 3-deoxy-D-manno-octulosonic acid kinase [Gammaproteobacteria bacterium]
MCQPDKIVVDTYRKIDGGAILFNPEAAKVIEPEYFEPEFWRRQGTVLNAEAGRGTVVFVNAGATQWALRHCHRGGMVGRLLSDHYLWLGQHRVRSFREFELLRTLYAKGLPVPKPVAARYLRHGLAYTSDLVTERIPGARPLSQRLVHDSIPESAWRSIGEGIRRIHEAGAYHPDLTAHNILLDEDAGMHLVDFDRGRLRSPGGWHAQNLQRLKRSLNKISGTMPGVSVQQHEWEALLDGYGRP